MAAQISLCKKAVKQWQWISTFLLFYISTKYASIK